MKQACASFRSGLASASLDFRRTLWALDPITREELQEELLKIWSETKSLSQ